MIFVASVSYFSEQAKCLFYPEISPHSFPLQYFSVTISFHNIWYLSLAYVIFSQDVTRNNRNLNIIICQWYRKLTIEDQSRQRDDRIQLQRWRRIHNSDQLLEVSAKNLILLPVYHNRKQISKYKNKHLKPDASHGVHEEIARCECIN